MISLAGRTRIITWIAYSLLLAQQLIYVWSAGAPWIIWLFHLLPLVMFLPGMLRDNLRSFIWLCFVCLLYFMRLVVSLFENPTAPLAIVGMIAVVILFCSGMMYVRWRARELREAAASGSGHGD